MAIRNFIVIHTLGAQWVNASSAAEAVRLCSVPGGYRHARGVVEAAIVGSCIDDASPTRTRLPEERLIAFIGQPV